MCVIKEDGRKDGGLNGRDGMKETNIMRLRGRAEWRESERRQVTMVASLLASYLQYMQRIHTSIEHRGCKTHLLHSGITKSYLVFPSSQHRDITLKHHLLKWEVVKGNVSTSEMNLNEDASSCRSLFQFFFSPTIRASTNLRRATLA